MFAICIESSHQRGMGHFFRALNFIDYLQHVKEPYVVLINDDEASICILKQRKIPYEIINYQDTKSCWEIDLIRKYKFDVWLLDRFATGYSLCEHVKSQNVLLCGIDDCGEGAGCIDIHFCSMLFSDLKGKEICEGKEYLILNHEIEKYKRKRTEMKKVVVTLGGCDTYGVTIKIVKILKDKGYRADIVVGPNFRHWKALRKEVEDTAFGIYQNVPSLVEFFSHYDLAITGGGVTCFEANAAGLPCIIVANELHEITIAKYIVQFGGAVFAGYYKELQPDAFSLEKYEIGVMSDHAIKSFDTEGVKRIYKKIAEKRGKNER